MTEFSKKNGKNRDFKERIITLLKDDHLSTREISEEIGATYATTLKYLDVLHASSLVENKVYGKTKVWTLKKKNPLEFNQYSLAYHLIEKSWEQFKTHDFARKIFDSAFSKLNKTFVDKIGNSIESKIIIRYLELEKNAKWKELPEYDLEVENSNIMLKIFSCKYKFHCCFPLKEKNIPILCIEGQRILNLLNLMSNKKYSYKLNEFSISPNLCRVLFSVTPNS